ncbi:MAG: metallophosphoesterase family protein, partial [Phycisphaerales bacterium]|nr:metallophosphoesterase family protein [Phycisphaerales bacterium]
MPLTSMAPGGTCLRRSRHLVAIAGAVAILLVHGVGWADDEDVVERVPDQTAYRATPMPDRIVLSWTGDPVTTQAVTWRTDPSVVHAIGQVAPAGDGPGFVGEARTIDAVTVSLDAELGLAHYHSVNFEGLSPETDYAYRVGDGTDWSEWSHFRTASEEPKPFTFVYFGDAQNNVKSLWSRVVREAYRDAPRAAFLLHAGDLVDDANSDVEWGEWFYASGFIHRSTPCVATPGNHEYASGLSRHWRPTFSFPINGPEGLEETVYYFDYQGARIVSLNSMENPEAQIPWLERVLSEEKPSWTILTFHHPIYSAAKDRDNPELRDLWQPVFDRFKVDLVLQGHDHTYARSKLISHENVAEGVTKQSAAGTLYVVSVSGPKMYEVKEQPIMQKTGQNMQLYQIIMIDGAELRYEARTATGHIHDAFTLRKRPGQVNELVERLPPGITTPHDPPRC